MPLLGWNPFAIRLLPPRNMLLGSDQRVKNGQDSLAEGDHDLQRLAVPGIMIQHRFPVRYNVLGNVYISSKALQGMPAKE